MSADVSAASPSRALIAIFGRAGRYISAAQKMVAALALLSAPLVGNAETVTYDFTGTVTSSSGVYSTVAVGTTVTGSYTFNLANGTSADSYGTIGSQTSEWYVGASGGSALGTPPPLAGVFSSAAQVDGFSYSTSSAPGAYYSSSSVFGNNGPVYGGGARLYDGAEENCPIPGSCTDSQFSISIAGSAFLVTGLPIPVAGLSNNSSYTGSFGGSAGLVAYSINDLTPVPLPQSAWLMLSGLVGIGAMAGRKRALAVRT